MQEDVPEKMADTRKLWELFKQNKYDAYLSQVTLQEIEDCPEPRRSELRTYLDQVEYDVLAISQEVLDVAKKIIELGILTQKSFDDCQHIGAAIVGGCDCIASWNFKHIVNVKTIRGIRAITSIQGYKPIEIWSPSVLLESGE